MELDDCTHSVWTKWSKTYQFCSFDSSSSARQRNEICRLCLFWVRAHWWLWLGPLLNTNRSTRSFWCSRCSRSKARIHWRWLCSSTWRHGCLYSYSSSLRIKGHRFCRIHVRIIHDSFWNEMVLFVTYCWYY